jgi:hypothetical protein
MPENESRQFAVFLIFWIVYFLLVYAVLMRIYLRLRGNAPKNENQLVLIEGRPVPARTVWEERDRTLRKRFRRIGLSLMLFPLLIPLLLALLG